MPLPRYGVAIGTLIRFYRDPADDVGRWYHGHVEVSTPSGMWTSALDVDTETGLGISYRVSRNLPLSALGLVSSLPDGFHPLASHATSGAVDYLRSDFLRDGILGWTLARTPGLPRHRQPLPPPLPPNSPPRPRPALSLSGRLGQQVLRLLQWPTGHLPFPYRIRPWLRSNGDNALRALEAELIGNRRVYLFGDRFRNNGKGVHDVHQNQGDPAGSDWWSQNGIWQDGVVAVERENGTLFVWQVRFNSQATQTDNAGHPL